MLFRSSIDSSPDDCGLVFSQDCQRLFLTVYRGETRKLEIRDANDGALLSRLSAKDEFNGVLNWCLSNNGAALVSDYDEENAALWRRRRPEWWWGVAYLPEFWCTLVIALGFVWSVRRDWREMGRKAEGGTQNAEAT